MAQYASSIYMPSSVIKVQMSATDLMTAVNSVTGYCNFTQMLHQFSKLLNYTDYSAYVQLAATAGGSLIAAVPKEMTCINESKAGGDGFGVGLCSANIFTMLLDIKL